MVMRHLPIAGLLALLAGCQDTSPPPEPTLGLLDLLGDARWVDLTHAFNDSTIYWPNNPTGFVLTEEFAGITEGGWYYSSYHIDAPEHGGTHMDAPVHFAEGGSSTDRIPVTRLAGEGCVLDLTEAVGEDADHLVGLAEVEAWEARHGRIPDSAIVLFRTGWERYYDDRARCLGTPKTGEAALPELHFPGIDPELAEWLVRERRPKLVGLDTPSLDRGQSVDFQTHRILSAAGVPGLENVANLGALPPKGAFILAFPMKIKGGSGGPLRVVACLPGS